MKPKLAPSSRAKRPAVASVEPGKRTAIEVLTLSAAETKPGTVRKGSFLPSVDPSVPPHTLLLGTQPSDNSLAHGQYFMTNANAFWHIVGDALGFRRGFHIAGRTDAPDYIRRHLLHCEEVSYDEAIRRLTARGYALWDVIAESERKGSLDGDIKNATFADVQSLVARHPSIRRICFSSGATTAKFFRRTHKAWLATPGAFVACPGCPESRAIFTDRWLNIPSAAAAPTVREAEGVAACVSTQRGMNSMMLHQRQMELR